ncbi:MAG: asparagine synthase C-terminal domain-containing protein, partial [Lachnospiraceae bacterium]
ELLSDEFLDYLKMDDYVLERYHQSVAETPRCEEDSPREARRREISYLNIRWFMQTLLNRMDRTSMYHGLEARVPFADTRIVQYVWNVPWEMKARQGVVKNLLREAGRGLLPEEVLFRRKSPYPKTYDPLYENLLKSMVRETILDGNSPVLQFVDKKKVERFLGQSSDYGKPWYGQLMAGPQMLAYLLQIDEWMKRYQIKVVD